MESQHILTNEEKFCLQVVSGYKQYCTMRGRFESEVCTFCEFDTDLNKILYDDGHWVAWENAFKGDRALETMLVVASKNHLRSLSKITKEDWIAFYDCMQWAEENYDLPGGMLMMRFGNMRLNGGSVPHLHWNVWVPNKQGESKTPIYYSQETLDEYSERAEGFSSRYEAGEIPE